MVASASSPLSSLAVVPEFEPLRLGRENEDCDEAGTASQKLLRAKRKNVLIVNVLAVLVTLGIFSILLEYTAIADRTARKTPRFQYHQLYKGGEENLHAEAAGNDGATQLYASLVDVYDESEEDDENDNNETPAVDAGTLNQQANLALGELYQLNTLYDACMTDEKDAVIDWSSSPVLREHDAPELLLNALRKCPDVDVFVPATIRGDHEYCQDAAVYTKFLQSRMLPSWVLDAHFHDASANRTVTYAELCPKTPLLFLNHHWYPAFLPEASKQSKSVYLSPNIDSTQLQREHLVNADVVLCKTKTCFRRVSAWYAQEAQRNANAVAAKVLYTRFTSPNPTVPLQRQPDVVLPSKEYSKPQFVHFAGASGSNKGTRQVLQCWLSKPQFPRLDVVLDDATYSAFFKSDFDAQIRRSPNVRVDTTLHEKESMEFAKRVTAASFVVAPSESESYGHTINQARAAGAVVVTTDAAPMNELVPRSSTMGVAVAAMRQINAQQFLGSGFKGAMGLQGGKGLVAHFTAENVCDAIEALLRNTQEQTRHAIAVRAHTQYYLDMHVFASAMTELRTYARLQAQKTRTMTTADNARSPVPEGVQRLGSVAPMAS
uniref:Glycosyl transferase family 1 domain-containing protein n=1 Tax=Globisporangium ultimum (strain ATCC 200006 / CBS 805.95 / DAOM BR144) TaxID=431595 RepID=K3WT97_GLOUD